MRTVSRFKPSIFISYRVKDASFPAAIVYTRLRRFFGPKAVFRDVDSLGAGDLYNDRIRLALQSSRVMVVVIDRGWLAAADSDGNKRLSNTHDWVRREIATALARGIRIIPLLVDETRMPGDNELPYDIKGLALASARRLRHESMAQDCTRLVREIHRYGVRRRAAVRATTVSLSGVILAATPLAGFYLIRHDGHANMSKSGHKSSAFIANDDLTRATVIPTGRGPFAIALGKTEAWVVNNNGNSVTEIGRQLTAPTVTIKVGNHPVGVAIDQKGDAWVSNNGSGTVMRIAPGARRPDLTVRTLAGPSEMVFDRGDIWLAETGGDMVARVNPETGKIVKQIHVSGGPATIAASGGEIWTGDINNNSITEIDANTNTVADVVSIGRTVLGVAVSPGAVWVATPATGSSGDELTEVNLGAGRNLSEIDVPALPSGVAASGSTVWLTCVNAGLVVRVGMGSLQIAGEYPVGQGPSHVAVSGNQVWVTNLDDNTVTVFALSQLNRLRLTDGDSAAGSVEQITVGNDPVGVDGGSGSVWVANANDGTVSQINPLSGRVVRTVAVGGHDRTVGVGDGAVWAVSDDKHQLVRIDPADGKVTGRAGILPFAEGVAFTSGSVWVPSGSKNVVERINPRTLAIEATIPVGVQPLRLASGFGSVWVGNGEGGSLARISVATGSVTNTIRIGPQTGGGVAVAFGYVWVSSYGLGEVVRVNPATDEITGTVKVGKDPLGLTAAAGLMWAADSANNTLVGIAPKSLKIVARLNACAFPQTVTAYSGYLWATCTNARSVLRVSP